jgi:hypothetical protein
VRFNVFTEPLPSNALSKTFTVYKESVLVSVLLKTNEHRMLEIYHGEPCAGGLGNFSGGVPPRY